MATELKTFQIFDTLSDSKQPVQTIEPGKVSMYVCGVTVYDLTHIGHARVFVFFDVVQRFLRHLGYDVNYVRNHTDVDDKIIRRANEVGEDPLALAQRFIDALGEDMGRLMVEAPDHEPKVSDHIQEIIEMNKALVEKGFAYESGGDVYYRVEKFDGYGKLSGRRLDDMEAGRSGRVGDDDDKKEHPFDFALWKAAKDGDVAWDSPWGKGRPGWHIECSAMSTKYLGANFDIHGGGRDLIFPHHENEIAQSEAATGSKFANYWMHVGMVNVAEVDEDGRAIERKMSKSLGNFWTTRDVLKGYHAEAIRYFMHTTAYRHPITYSEHNLNDATSRVEYLYTTLERLDEALEKAGHSMSNPPEDGRVLDQFADVLDDFLGRFEDGMLEDFNTPVGLALLGELAKVGNELTEKKKLAKGERLVTIYKTREGLTQAAAILGMLQREPKAALKELTDLKVDLLGIDREQVQAKIAERKQARTDKDWDRADAVRNELLAMRIEIMDGVEGTTWRVK